MLVYTFASSRAIRLDIVSDASCSSFICSLKQFISVNGVPDLYISDNAKCFTGRELKDYLSKLPASWRYILEVPPWWGGFWERMVQVVKRSLRKILSNSNLLMKTYSLLFVRSNQGSIQGRYVMFTTTVLRKSLRVHIICKHWLIIIGTDGDGYICPSCVKIINLQMLFQSVKSN